MLRFLTSLFISIGLLICGSSLVGCASLVPSNFLYETSLRGEQGLPGHFERADSAQSLLEMTGGMDPAEKLQSALPGADIKVKRWGLKYFGSDWTRYKVVLDADVENKEKKTRCREFSTETPVGAPTLDELLAANASEFQRQMEALIASCIMKENEVN